MKLEDCNEFNTFVKPEKPFILISQVKRTCDYMVTNKMAIDVIKLAAGTEVAQKNNLV